MRSFKLLLVREDGEKFYVYHDRITEEFWYVSTRGPIDAKRIIKVSSKTQIPNIMRMFCANKPGYVYMESKDALYRDATDLRDPREYEVTIDTHEIDKMASFAEGLLAQD